MIQIDGKPLDLTKPETLGDNIKIAPGGFIEQRKDGVTTKVTHEEVPPAPPAKPEGTQP
jgi:hypothetical protein